MIGSYFSFNGQLKPITEATVSFDNIWYAYGYGVYETLKIRKGHVFFVQQHMERLLASARLLSVEHVFSPETITTRITELVLANQVSDANIKILLVGGEAKEDSFLVILLLAPLFPNRKLYSQGAKTGLYTYERHFPQAKSLDMVGSAIAYKHAKKQGRYDALLTTHDGYILEGTRTNLFYTDGRILYTPPATRVLAGVTRETVIYIAHQEGILVEERDISINDIHSFQSYFFTSTSSKIVPITQINDYNFVIHPLVKGLMKAYDVFLEKQMN